LHQPEKTPHSAQKLPLFGLLLCSVLGACGPTAVEQDAPPPARVDSGCGENGALQSALFGSLETTVSWSGSAMNCESMLRPDGQGIRLRFTGDVTGERLAIIIAVPDLQAGEPAVGLPSNVTITVEGSGRFFRTPNLDSCWTDVNSPIVASDEKGPYAISGTL